MIQCNCAVDDGPVGMFKLQGASASASCLLISIQ